jgi:nitrite reductase/ring-hydroxylating ferredoxin subunit/uncharacterized membrane protein
MATGIVQAIVDRQKWLDELADRIQPLVNQAFNSGGEAGHVLKDFLNGVWLGHPLHPVITDVPIGAWTMTELLDLLSAAGGGDPALDRAADLTLGAGIVAAVGAAVTGLTDWSDVGGSHRRLGLLHGLLNVAGVGMNITSLGLRLGGNPRSRGLARGLSAGGYITTALAAYVAGELVFNLGMAVNRNAWASGPDRFTDVASVDELPEGQMVRFEVEGQPVVLIRHADGIHAFSGTCSHYGCGLWEGRLDDHVVTCPCHGSQFDVRDGRVVHGPATAPVPAFETRTRNGRVQVRLEQALRG